MTTDINMLRLNTKTSVSLQAHVTIRFTVLGALWENHVFVSRGGKHDLLLATVDWSG